MNHRHIEHVESPGLGEYTCPMHPEIVQERAGELPHLRHGSGAEDGLGGRRAESGTRRYEAAVLDQSGPDDSSC